MAKGLMKPGLSEYKRLSRLYSCVPVWREIRMDGRDPIAAFKKISGRSHAFMLESVERGMSAGRYTFMGFDPETKISFSRGKITVENRRGKRIVAVGSADPLKFIKSYFSRYNAPNIEGLPPFCGGAVGYVGYDYVRYIERIPAAANDDIKMPEYFFMVAKNVIVFDHEEECIKLFANTRPGPDPGKTYRACESNLERIEAVISAGDGGEAPIAGRKTSGFSSNVTKKAFCDSVKKAKKYIREGEIFQVVLSQRLRTKLCEPPLCIYETLRRINPSPYMFYLKMKDNYLIGSSPETHVKVIGEDITIRPIAGTRKRGKTAAEDAILQKDLLSDEKEKAEHLMLVDLARNDVGRVARAGTVKVDEFMKVLKYSHVMHIESNVIGKLEEGKDRFDVFACSFPAGTVSGAPKIRAMEIISELEPARRGTYAGAVGYFSFSGNMDTCITIRTILVKGREVYVQAGAGVVADSVPEKEYDETMNKAKALVLSLGGRARGAR